MDFADLLQGENSNVSNAKEDNGNTTYFVSVHNVLPYRIISYNLAEALVQEGGSAAAGLDRVRNPEEQLSCQITQAQSRKEV